MTKSCHVAGAMLLCLAVVVAGCGGAAGVRQTAPAAREPAHAARAARAKAVESARALFLAAEAAGGEYSDPYSYYMAKEYLELAEHELNGGDIRGVTDFAEKSKRYSAVLVGKAGEVPQ